MKLKAIVVGTVLGASLCSPVLAGGISMADKATPFVAGEAVWPNTGYVDACLGTWYGIVGKATGKQMQVGKWTRHGRITFANVCPECPSDAGCNFGGKACVSVSRVLQDCTASGFTQCICNAASHEAYEMQHGVDACDNKANVMVDGMFPFPDCTLPKRAAKRTGCTDVFGEECK
jgi:hypothetical protein